MAASSGLIMQAAAAAALPAFELPKLRNMLNDMELRSSLLLFLMSRRHHSMTIHDLVRPDRKHALDGIPVGGYRIMRAYFDSLPELFILVGSTVCLATMGTLQDEEDADDEPQPRHHRNGVHGGAGGMVAHDMDPGQLLHRCKLCDMHFASPDQLTDHVRGDQHQRRLAAADYGSSFSLPTYAAMYAGWQTASPPVSPHAHGAIGDGAAAAPGEANEGEQRPADMADFDAPAMPAPPGGDSAWRGYGRAYADGAQDAIGGGGDWFRCTTCREEFNDEIERRAHFLSARHRIAQTSKLLRRAEWWAANRGDVVVSTPPEDTVCVLGQVAHLEVTVLNNGDRPLAFKSFNLLRRTPGVSVCDGGQVPPPGFCITLQPGATERLTVTLQPQAVGVLLDVLVLEFESFCLARRITATFDPQFDVDLVDISARAPFQRPPRPALDSRRRQIVPGEQPMHHAGRTKFKFTPGYHPCPTWLVEMVQQERWDELEQALEQPATNIKTYADKLARLLWLEELQHEVDIRQFDMSGAAMAAGPNNTLLLQVPGLAENRPSVMVGDALYVSRCRAAEGGSGEGGDAAGVGPDGWVAYDADDDTGVEYQGYVLSVHADQVRLRFRPDFHDMHQPEHRFNVRFSVCRSSFNFMQSAIKRVAGGLLHLGTVMGEEGMALAAAAEAAAEAAAAAAAKRHAAAGQRMNGDAAALPPAKPGARATSRFVVRRRGTDDGKAPPRSPRPVLTSPRPGSSGSRSSAPDAVSDLDQGPQLAVVASPSKAQGGRDRPDERSGAQALAPAVMQHLAQVVHDAQGVDSTAELDLLDEPQWIDGGLNEQQKQAVRSIVSGGHVPMPYIIFGPPGTGKTTTITEAALQVLLMIPASRLLMVAPSNAAADELALRLLQKIKALTPEDEETPGPVDPACVYRCCAFTRQPDDLPEPLRQHSNLDAGEGVFPLPSLEVVKRARVVLSTCLVAAKLHALGVAPGHFTHVFIDEAGHADEPLTLTAMAGLVANDKSARVVLAGDPRQLGPVIMSPVATRHGLGVSMMERLLTVQPYLRRQDAPPGTAPYDSRYITKLVVNYRSHEGILAVPNAAFYDGELVANAPRAERNSMLTFRQLPNPSFPIIFHAIVGRDEREGSSPSWFNQAEAKLVLMVKQHWGTDRSQPTRDIINYINALQAMGVGKPHLQDVGVITPYRKQIQKLRELLYPHYEYLVKVSSVEEFQGQERRVIIISTVRSAAEHLEFDTKYRLGFLSNPKRFNVAITRAKSLLVVVGNPNVLMHDPYWMAFLVYVHRNGGSAGNAMPAEVVTAAAAADAAGLPKDHAWPGYEAASEQAPYPASCGGADAEEAPASMGAAQAWDSMGSGATKAVGESTQAQPHAQGEDPGDSGAGAADGGWIVDGELWQPEEDGQAGAGAECESAVPPPPPVFHPAPLGSPHAPPARSGTNEEWALADMLSMLLEGLPTGSGGFQSGQPGYGAETGADGGAPGMDADAAVADAGEDGWHFDDSIGVVNGSSGAVDGTVSGAIDGAIDGATDGPIPAAADGEIDGVGVSAGAAPAAEDEFEWFVADDGPPTTATGRDQPLAQAANLGASAGQAGHGSGKQEPNRPAVAADSSTDDASDDEELPINRFNRHLVGHLQIEGAEIPRAQ